MKIITSRIKRFLTHPLASDLDVEAALTVRTHRALIRKKTMLKWVYKRWYRELERHVRATASLSGPMIEVGCGAGFLDKVIPGVLRTDAVSHAYVNRVMQAEKLEFGDSELRCLFMVNVLHHLEEPARFLAEAQRCLAPGGRLVLIEQYPSWFNRLLCGGVEHYEYFDLGVKEWKNSQKSRYLEANLALPWVIFFRDRERFEREFPRLKFKEVRRHTFLPYAVSGGMTFRAFLPVFAIPVIEAVEWLATPLMRWLGTGMTLALEKSSEG